MDGQVLDDALDELYDHALVFHGFTDYTRDYEVIVFLSSDPRSGIAPVHRRYLFKHCVQATVTTMLRAETFAVSMDERYLTFDDADPMLGYVWAVRWQCLYPGGCQNSDSEIAQQWTEAVGVGFFEVELETNVQRITLVFADFSVDDVPSGYTPFVVPDDGRGARIPLA